MRLTRSLLTLQTAMLSMLNDGRQPENKSFRTDSPSSVLNTDTSQCDSTTTSKYASTATNSFNYHEPPIGVEYAHNPSVFGRILEGALPSTTYAESDELYAFQDIYPRAKLHSLVIPKKFIPSVKCLLSTCSCCSADGTHDTQPTSILNRKRSLTNNVPVSSNSMINRQTFHERLALVLNMKQMACSILQKKEPAAYQKGDYILCFHVPPYNSVDHLHLHILAPASEMNWAYRYCKYLCGTPWCLDLEELIHRLENRIKEDT